MTVFGPVNLSTLLRNYLAFVHGRFYNEEVPQALEHLLRSDVGDNIELACAEQYLLHTDEAALNKALKGFDGYKPFLIRQLGAELVGLIEVWGNEYPIDTLLEINRTGLATHMRLDEIEIEHGFELEGPEGDGGSGIRKQWKRVANPIDDQIMVKVTYAYDGTSGETSVMPGDKIVRPHYGGPRSEGHVGSEIPTPDEVRDRKQRWADYRVASDAIDARIDERFKQEGITERHMTYSVYPTDERDVPIDNLDEVAIQGRAVLVDDCFANDKSYQSGIVENPTWLDLCVLFNACVEQTEDYHHVFLEGVTDAKREIDGVAVWQFSTGS